MDVERAGSDVIGVAVDLAGLVPFLGQNRETGGIGLAEALDDGQAVQE